MKKFGIQLLKNAPIILVNPEFVAFVHIRFDCSSSTDKSSENAGTSRPVALTCAAAAACIPTRAARHSRAR